MRRSRQKTIPPVLERFELKYLIPFDMIDPISCFLSAYCSPDVYSLNSETGFYRVNSLYLDSPAWTFLKMRIEDVDNRINMRVRSYGDNPKPPYFLEIKQKRDGTVRKYRASVRDKGWYRRYTVPGFQTYDGHIDEKEKTNVELFERLVYTYDAAPVVLTQYLRKAWISEVDDYARVTFDVDLRFRPEDSYNPVPGKTDMVSCDHNLFFDPECSVILELKCYTNSVPLWMLDLIRLFDLKRSSFSKYAAGASELLGLYRYDSALRTAAFAC